MRQVLTMFSLTGALGVYAADGVTFKGYVAADFSATYYADLVSVSNFSRYRGSCSLLRRRELPLCISD
jgi:hypothetical protein